MYQSYVLSILRYDTRVDLILLDMAYFDLILGMHCLYAKCMVFDFLLLDCHFVYAGIILIVWTGQSESDAKWCHFLPQGSISSRKGVSSLSFLCSCYQY